MNCIDPFLCNDLVTGSEIFPRTPLELITDQSLCGNGRVLPHTYSNCPPSFTSSLIYDVIPPFTSTISSEKFVPGKLTYSDVATTLSNIATTHSDITSDIIVLSSTKTSRSTGDSCAKRVCVEQTSRVEQKPVCIVDMDDDDMGWEDYYICDICGHITSSPAGPAHLKMVREYYPSRSDVTGPL